MAVTVNGLTIDDNVTYLIEEITYKNMPQRDVQRMPISTRPGSKLVASEWSEKEEFLVLLQQIF